MALKDDRNNQTNPVAKAWVFTIHPEKLPFSIEEYIAKIEAQGWRYVAISLEEGEKEGKPHLQGYAVPVSPQRWLAACEKLLLGLWEDKQPGRVFARRGTHIEARDYVLHEGKHSKKKGALLQTWILGSEAGLASGDKSASEYSQLIAAMYEGATDGELLQQFPWLYVRYYHNIAKIRAELVGSSEVRLAVQRRVETREAADENN